MPFTGQVHVSPILPEGRNWTVEKAFTYSGRQDTFTVPVGFTTDFASVPRIFTWLLPRYGRWTQAAILHDYLWSLAEAGQIAKFDADGIFNRAMRELGVPYLRRWIMWTAVRWAAGPKTWFHRGPVPFLKMLVMTLLTVPVVIGPAAVIAVALVVGIVAEFIAYVPLRLVHRDKTKDVNPPELRDLIES